VHHSRRLSAWRENSKPELRQLAARTLAELDLTGVIE